MRPERRPAEIARCLSLAFVVTLFAAERLSADGAAITVDVHHDSCPSLAVARLARAEDQAKRIFAHAGIRVLWRAHAMSGGLEKPNGRRVHLVLLCGEAAERRISAEALGARVLGEALHDAARAYIYADRVSDVALRKGFDVAMVLGRVAAHEMGHLVLPPRSHSAAGIMRADLDFHRRLPETFTAAERRTMLQNLRHATPDAAGEALVSGRSAVHDVCVR